MALLPACVLYVESGTYGSGAIACVGRLIARAIYHTCEGTFLRAGVGGVSRIFPHVLAVVLGGGNGKCVFGVSAPSQRITSCQIVLARSTLVSVHEDEHELACVLRMTRIRRRWRPCDSRLRYGYKEQSTSYQASHDHSSNGQSLYSHKGQFVFLAGCIHASMLWRCGGDFVPPPSMGGKVACVDYTC